MSKTATLAHAPKSWTPGATKAKANKTKAKGAAKNSAKGKSSSTALARRPNGVTPATAQKFMAEGAKLERAKLAANGRLAPMPNKKGKKGKGKKKNGATRSSFLPGFLARNNPGLSGLLDTAKAGAIALGGGIASRIEAALITGLGQRFNVPYAASKYAPPVLTFLAAVFLTPWVFGWLKMSEATQRQATAGGVLFALGEALGLVTGGDIAGSLASRAHMLASGEEPAPAANGQAQAPARASSTGGNVSGLEAGRRRMNYPGGGGMYGAEYMRAVNARR